MYRNNRQPSFSSLIRIRPHAWADIVGSERYPDIHGNAMFYQTEYGVLVAVEVYGLPSPQGVCQSPIFGFHIHEGGSCTGNSRDPFADVLSHFDPHNCPHPYHAGDLPPLFGVNGHAFSAFLTGRFRVDDIIGKTIIIHSAPDDFTTQPSGNSGNKMACGEIMRFFR